MPRNISTALADHYQGNALTITNCLRLTRKDGTVLGFTSLDVPITVDGILYQPAGSVQSDAVKSSSSTGIDTLNIQGLLSSGISSSFITDADIRAGKYDNAEVLLFQVNYLDLTMGKLIILRGYIGEVTLTDGQYSAELRGLSQQLKQVIGDLTSPGCRVKRLGDAQCKVNMTGYTFTRTITAVGSSASGGSATAVVQINAGGGASSPYAADSGYSGSAGTFSTSDTIDTSGVSNPAPQAVYQSHRFGKNLSYLLTGYNVGQEYKVRLHFCEGYHGVHGHDTGTGQTAVGKRTFNVILNGYLIASELDVYNVSGGADKAYVIDYDIFPASDGSILIQLNAVVDNAMISGIEVYTEDGGSISNGVTFGSDTHPSGFFTYGVVTFTSGQNAGFAGEVKSHINSSGAAVVTFRLPFPYPVSVGDVATLEAGCDRAWSTCRDKFANTLNFHGFSLLPGNDTIIQVARPTQ